MLVAELIIARRASGWSQRTLANRIGTSTQSVRRMEKGVGSVSTVIAAMSALKFQPTGIGPGATLHERLRGRRRRLGMSIAMTAERTGLSRTTIISLERGGGSIASLVRLLTVIAPRVRRQAPERAYWGQGDKIDRDSRFTPPEFLANVVAAFGEIDVDPCAHPLSPVVARRRIIPGEGGDGLAEDWKGRLAFVNPPFSELLRWLRRAHEQWRLGNVETVVCLVPVRTDSALFHETLSADADIYLLRGRVRFLDPRGRCQQTPFSLMVLTLGASDDQKRRYGDLTPGFWLSRQGPTDQVAS